MDTHVLDWIVVGAGPAGIAALGKLLDQGIPPKQLGWIDPHFVVGDLGIRWNHVPSNTSAGLFLRFLNDCKAFDYPSRPSQFPIDLLKHEENCPLQYIVEPLQWVTNHLRKKVHAWPDMAMNLTLSHGRWAVKMKNSTVFAKKVILAIGSDPKNLSLAGPDTEIIPLEIALNPEKLTKSCSPKDTIAIFGSSHSALLVLANLHALKANMINFYRSPHRYAVYLKDWILFDNTGLKGFTAQWAKQHIDGILPTNLNRIHISAHTFEASLALCNKVVYATGFERRKLPVLEQFESLDYDDRTGIIAPNLFGLGIAFPQAKFDPLGRLEFSVGLWKFMDYLNGILPIWLSQT